MLLCMLKSRPTYRVQHCTQVASGLCGLTLLLHRVLSTVSRVKLFYYEGSTVNTAELKTRSVYLTANEADD